MKIAHSLFWFLSFFIFQQGYSQIKINASGKVGVAGYEPSSHYDIRGGKAYFDQSKVINSKISYSYVYESASIAANPSNNYTLRIGSESYNVSDAVYIDGAKASRAALYVNGLIKSTMSPDYDSDARLKKEITNLDSKKLFRKLSRIRGKSYKFKNRRELLALHNSGQLKFIKDTIYKKTKTINERGDTIRVLTDEIKKIRIKTPKYSKKKQYGVIAQDVLEEFPELVGLDENSGIYAVNYNGFIPLLLEAVNLQQEEVSKMSRQIDRLKARIKVLENN